MPGTLRNLFLRRWHAGILLAASVALALLIGTTLAAVFCKWYWGYIFSPRAMDPVITTITCVDGYSELYVNVDGSLGVAAFEPQYDMTHRQTWYRQEPYYIPRFRILDHLESQGLLGPTTRCITDETANAAASLVQNTLGKKLTAPDFQRFSPKVIACTAGDRKYIIILAVLDANSWDGDHFRHHELLFDVTTQPRLLSRRAWQFDVAGIEGAEFSGIAILLCVPLSMLFVLPTAVYVLYRRFSKGNRIARGHCPRCDYDLCHQFQRGCSECGWRDPRSRAATPVP